MPRANRDFVAGHVYHLTHRCHNRQFLFRFAQDRDRYRKILRQGVIELGISLLDFCVTGNHAHLLTYAEPLWTESVAVGSETFVRQIASRIQGRRELEFADQGDQWLLCEAPAAYGGGCVEDAPWPASGESDLLRLNKQPSIPAVRPISIVTEFANTLPSSILLRSDPNVPMSATSGKAGGLR